VAKPKARCREHGHRIADTVDAGGRQVPARRNRKRDPVRSVTRETDVSASVIAQTNSIATQAFRLYTAIRSFGSALKLPALNRRLRSQHGRGRQVEPPTTANGGKSEGSAIAKRPDEGWRVTKTKLPGVAQDLAVDVAEQPGLHRGAGTGQGEGAAQEEGPELGRPRPFLGLRFFFCFF